MADKLVTQLSFKKALWTCPSCGQEDVEDRPMEGGASYEHDCSKCSEHFNQSGNNMREYNGILQYLSTEYAAKTPQEIEADKTAKFNVWVDSVKNPPTPPKPTKKQREDDYRKSVQYAQRDLELFAEEATAQELQDLKTDTISSLTDVSK